MFYLTMYYPQVFSYYLMSIILFSPIKLIEAIPNTWARMLNQLNDL